MSNKRKQTNMKSWKKRRRNKMCTINLYLYNERYIQLKYYANMNSLSLEKAITKLINKYIENNIDM